MLGFAVGDLAGEPVFGVVLPMPLEEGLIIFVFFGHLGDVAGLILKFAFAVDALHYVGYFL